MLLICSFVFEAQQTAPQRRNRKKKTIEKVQFCNNDDDKKYACSYKTNEIWHISSMY